jgi:predicted small secreted protein
MKQMKKTIYAVALTVVALSFSLSASNAFAGCEKTKGGAKSEFSGDSLDGLSVDKKAMATLNKKFPGLSITEKVFSGTIQTCTDCKDNFVTCNE